MEAIERLRFHGLKKARAPMRFEVLEPSGKANMPDVSAAIGLAQLPRLHQFNATRRALAGLYSRAMERPDRRCGLPARGDRRTISWHIFAPLLPVDARSVNRTAFIKAMEKRKIGVGVHYPAIHLFCGLPRHGLPRRPVSQCGKGGA